MKLVTFRDSGTDRVGVVLGDEIADLSAVKPELVDMVDLIARGDGGLAAAGDRIERAPKLPSTDVELRAPFIPRKNVMAVGRNYREHIHEIKDEPRPVPENPIIFTKPPTSVIGPGEAIDTANDPSGTTDYEGELGVVIGPGGIRIRAEDAWDHVYGYTIVNDVTARALQRKHGQWLIGKGPDTFCPMGPVVVTKDEIADVSSLWVRTSVNGEERQAAPVSDMVFDIPTLIATLSSVMTLEPGDVIATGTPAGVGMGMEPPVFLAPGDVVEVSIDGIGTLTNPVI
ncbi:MAG: hydrolase [Acidimicrobiia bacterium]|nr:hydrolase [Acidimicrobiia bacterium]